MPVFNNILAGAAGQTTGGAAAAGPIKSVRFNEDDSAYLYRTPSSAGNRKTWTWSAWVKVAENTRNWLFSCSDTVNSAIELYSNGDLYVYHGDTGQYVGTTAIFRDFSAWYHFVVTYDTTQATAANRIRLYVNGVQTALDVGTQPTLDWENTTGINSTNTHRIGHHWSSSSNYLNCYLTDNYFIDGSALDPTSFGAFDDNGVWQAAAYSGSYGTNGFHLFDFANESGIGDDSSGNNNDWTVNNLSTTAGAGNDVLFDVPTNGSADDDTGAGGEVSGNYCTWNPLDKATVTLTNGNLDITAASTDHCVRGTIAVPESVKIYYEFTVTQRGGGGAQSPIVGVANTSFDLDTNPDSQTSTVWAYTGSGAKLGGGSSYTSYGSSLSADDVLGVAIDRSAGRIWFSLNGTWQNSGDPTNSTDTNAAFTNVPTTGTLFIFFGNNNSTPGLGILNAGQRAFAYSAPTDYKTLCTTNLPSSDVPDGSDHFDIATWAGNSSTQSITGLSFQPDFLWYKSLSAFHHGLQDAVRGVGKTLSTSRIDITESTETDGLDVLPLMDLI